MTKRSNPLFVRANSITSLAESSPPRGAVITWTYRDADGTPVFQHYRKPRTPTPDDPRSKKYGYRYPVMRRGSVVDWVYRKHPLADTLVYRLPQFLAIDPTEDVWWSEGERDCDALVSAGAHTVAHHGGAGKATRRQAEWLRGRRGQIILIADRDVPGAYDAIKRYDLLRSVDIAADQLKIVRASVRRKGADARDHLDAGYGLNDFITLDIARLRDIAATITSSGFSASDYRDGWVPEEEWQLTPEEKAVGDIKSWTPIKVRKRR